MDDKNEALVATLQLLLSDVPDDTKRGIFCRAFPYSFVLLKGSHAAFKGHMIGANLYLKNAGGMTDGQSPLGKMAIQAVNRDISAANARIERAAAMFGISL
jgi:hypothetical protein